MRPHSSDERTAYVANKARSMAFFICIYVQLAAALLAILVFDQTLVGQVLCGLTCLQGLLYTRIFTGIMTRSIEKEKESMHALEVNGAFQVLWGLPAAKRRLPGRSVRELKS